MAVLAKVVALIVALSIMRPFVDRHPAWGAPLIAALVPAGLSLAVATAALLI